jgi:hypothetical protein
MKPRAFRIGEELVIERKFNGAGEVFGLHELIHDVGLDIREKLLEADHILGRKRFALPAGSEAIQR